MFHYQVGSLEEEPAVLACRARRPGPPAARGDPRPVAGRQPVRRVLRRGGATLGLETTAVTAISPLAEDLAGVVADSRHVARLARLPRAGRLVAPIALGPGRRRLGRARRRQLRADVRLRRPDWRDGWKGWEYIDGIADDNERRRALGAQDARAAGGPVGCAAYDMGPIVGEALAARPPHPRRDARVIGIGEVASGHLRV